MASIEEVRAGITVSADRADEAQLALSQATEALEQAQYALGVLEGSSQHDADQLQSIMANIVGNQLPDAINAVRTATEKALEVRDRIGGAAVSGTVATAREAPGPSGDTKPPAQPMLEKGQESQIFVPPKNILQTLGVNRGGAWQAVQPHVASVSVPSENYTSRVFPKGYVEALGTSDEWKEPGASPGMRAENFSSTKQAHDAIIASKRAFDEKVHILANQPLNNGMLSLRDIAELCGVNTSTVGRWHTGGLLDEAGVRPMGQGKSGIPAEKLHVVMRWLNPQNYDPRRF